MIRPVLRVAAASLMLAGCVTANEVAMKVGQPPEQQQQIRETETRRWLGQEQELLSEATQVLQDLGYTITESSAPAGVLAGNKHRDAREAGQVVGAILVAVLAGANAARWDTDQLIQVTLTTWPERPSGLVLASTAQAPQRIAMRVSFERLVQNNRGEVRHETLSDQTLMQEFYNRLQQSLAGKAQPL
ncbi:hypothetical protein [Pseudoroseomonas cervicalis]|uniref:hypothetical protein n=1 Tax=Teichococcus cervicalis TaxID=204525 RepID=UPI00277F5143|nr:hypothetical protein [Pseudoroseomonas cervicalis]MDQ1078619.1 hypothetical protein [Pseudoroseomonas cervicalis]